ncbi:MAG: hypothetical protein WCJ41_09770 [Aestuariivirga sp.]|uniref:hypothetical protein n=1 Tax=Aestuariivirga sp. TaxID=2650926 RepID=UPI0030187910
MKTLKMALMAGAAVAVSAAVAHADELSDMKAQIEALNARVASMETAPSVPSGYQLLAVSKGEALQVPGMLGSDRDRVTNDRATIISVMPTADAPAGATISWSGYVRAAVIYSGEDQSGELKQYDANGDVQKTKFSYTNDDDWDVKARGQLKVVANTDTAVGEVGVLLKMRADFNGNGTGNVYMKEAWGYWAMTPELTFGGGYSGSLGNIGYGYDGACTCYYTDNADVGFDPGDTTQLRLSYESGPFSMAVALEDSGLNNRYGNDNKYVNGQNMGVAGEIKYSGDAFSGEISGVYRTVNSDDYSFGGAGVNVVSKTPFAYDAGIDSLWQVGAGVGFSLGDIASLSLAAAMGSGPFEEVSSSGDIVSSYPVQNDWWGVSALASANLSDTFHAEAGVGYKNREGDSHDGVNWEDTGPVWKYSGFEYDTWAVLGGIYYDPVDQLTIGLEGEWYTTDASISRKGVDGEATDGQTDKFDYSTNNWTVDLVSVWRF